MVGVILVSSASIAVCLVVVASWAIQIIVVINIGIVGIDSSLCCCNGRVFRYGTGRQLNRFQTVHNGTWWSRRLHLRLDWKLIRPCMNQQTIHQQKRFEHPPILPRFPSPFGKGSMALPPHAVRTCQTFSAGKQFLGPSMQGPSSLRTSWQVGGKPKPKPRVNVPQSLQRFSAEGSHIVHVESHLDFASVVNSVEKRRRIQESVPQPRQQNIARVRNASDCVAVQQLWKRILEIFGYHSTLLRELSYSSQKTEHMNRFLNQFAANTLVKYFGAFDSLVFYLHFLQSGSVVHQRSGTVRFALYSQVGTAVEWSGA